MHRQGVTESLGIAAQMWHTEPDQPNQRTGGTITSE